MVSSLKDSTQESEDISGTEENVLGNEAVVVVWRWIEVNCSRTRTAPQLL